MLEVLDIRHEVLPSLIHVTDRTSLNWLTSGHGTRTLIGAYAWLPDSLAVTLGKVVSSDSPLPMARSCVNLGTH